MNILFITHFFVGFMVSEIQSARIQLFSPTWYKFLSRINSINIVIQAIYMQIIKCIIHLQYYRKCMIYINVLDILEIR